MNRVGVLCDKDREMMLEFSGLCVRRLNNHLPLKIFLSLFQPFLDANVLKEVEKDRLIIEQASAEFVRGKTGAEIDVDGLFEVTKEVDREFLKGLSTPVFSMEVRYDDFAEIRKRRILSLVNMVIELLCNWNDSLPFSVIVKNTFAEESYQSFLKEVLHLYNVETRLLSNSITFHGPANKMKDIFAARLFDTMEKTAGDIAVTYTRKLYAAPVAASSQAR